MRRPRTGLFLGALAVAASACGAEARVDEPEMREAASIDTHIVPISDRGLWTRSPRLIQELRFGQMEGDDRYLFGRIGELAVAEDGTIFVADEQGPRLRMYDADGRFVREIGRAGGGPGEYRQIAGLEVTPAGELVLFDPSLRRLSFFSASGEFVRSFDSRVGGSWADNSFHVDADGNFLVFGERASPGAPVMIGPDGTRTGSEGPGHQIRFYLKLSPK